ncbi:unnamed protein product [Enterobius vermicularis]|uniref:Ku domain-containing protein n=1 Tax=Enterobius vermicularis TaxID=51028 RepID=A0A0N4VDH1_ENTVE|nr:unnamed protein product [Enterobius vermicularis]
MAHPVRDTSTPAIFYAKEIVDWVLTRKIFTESPDEFVLVLFGNNETKNPFSSTLNIYYCEEEMQLPTFDWLKYLENEVKVSEEVEGDFLTALIEAVDFMRSSLKSKAENVVTGINILLVTNLLGHNLGGSQEDFDDANAAINGITSLNISLSVIGPDIQCMEENLDDEAMPESEQSVAKEDVKLTFNERLLTHIVEGCKGVAYSFSEALPILQHFVPRRVTARGQRFLFEIGEGVMLPLLFYKKIQLADMNLKFKKFDVSSNSEVKRETVYERICSEDDDTLGNERGFSKPSLLTKEDVVRGYTFGATIVPFNDADREEYGWKKEVRSLRLIQFSQRSQILHHYLMDGTAYYCIPPPDDKSLANFADSLRQKDGCVAVSALVRALVEEDKVAIARYVYNAASHPRLLALFPKISKKGVDMFIGIQLPFYDDFRGLEFPALENSTSEVKGVLLIVWHSFLCAEQSLAVEALIKAMDLSNSYLDPETNEYGEDLRPKNVPNPKLQMLCEAVKFKALHPNERLPRFECRILDELLNPRPQIKEKANFGKDQSSLPSSGHFITTDDLKMEE